MAMLALTITVCGLLAFLSTCWCINMDLFAASEDATKEIDAFEKAKHHIQEMDHHRCSEPVPKIFNVKSFYPSASKRYRPHCVRLHRCDQDAGCCKNERKKCVSSASEIVPLYFRVKDPFEGRRRKVVKMAFLNHTACHCTKHFPR
uniref:U33-Liphistoxin-Lsp1a_1 n=1 Tax=Liphistius sp. SGP-2016 TaxID=1905180 RepID=A0A4Q8K3K2_9ARAC